MDSNASGLGKVLVESIERVLSFLPVPDLGRIRCVCKIWNEIIGRPSFHDLCDLNGKNNVYLSLWGDDRRGFHGSVAPIDNVPTVFLLNNLSDTRERQALPRVYVHDSHTDDWRAMGNVLNDVVHQCADSAISLHQTVFVAILTLTMVAIRSDLLVTTFKEIHGRKFGE